MIDIRAVVAEIVKAKGASDVAAFQALTHACIRKYGQELLLNLAQAITATTPEEQNIVNWLKVQVALVAEQIPSPTEGTKT